MQDEARFGKVIGNLDKEWGLKRQDELKEEIDKLRSAQEDLQPMLGGFSSSKG
jgi:hypothetical protein